MGIGEIDISRLVRKSTAPDEKLVLDDLKYAVRHAKAYTRPSVEPINGHLAVVNNHESVDACREAGYARIECEFRDDLEERMRTTYGAVTPSSDERNFCWFYDTKEGPMPEKECMKILKEGLGSHLRNVVFHPMAGCIQVTIANTIRHEPDGYNNVIMTSFELANHLGPIRSVNGNKV